ncbi:hypothetical protein QL093DRAFT_2083483 [Fusarium oxysporum]|nr:hypothetical protein QL093DRAFT_2083483 [Fusarium oxysporum]
MPTTLGIGSWMTGLPAGTTTTTTTSRPELEPERRTGVRPGMAWVETLQVWVQPRTRHSLKAQTSTWEAIVRVMLNWGRQEATRQAQAPLNHCQVLKYLRKLQMQMLSDQPEDGVRKRRVGNYAPRKSNALHDKVHFQRFSSLIVCCNHDLRFAAVASNRDGSFIEARWFAGVEVCLYQASMTVQMTKTIDRALLDIRSS